MRELGGWKIVVWSGLVLCLMLLPSQVYAVEGIRGSSKGVFSLKNDHRREIRISSFGFQEGGFFAISVQNFQIIPANENDTAPIGLYLRKTSTASAASIETENFCFQAKENIESIVLNNTSMFFQFSEDLEFWEMNKTIRPEEEGLWTSSLINCGDRAISCVVEHFQYNPGPVYISFGEGPLPLVFGILAILYFICGLVWVVYLLYIKERRVLWPHWLMLILVVIKIITLILLSSKYQFMKLGFDDQGWAISYYVFTFLRGSLTFLILLLIGTGWIFVKPFLSSRDKKIFLVVIPLQIFTNVAQVVLSETEQGSGSWSFWSITFPVLDLLCCVLILAPILQTRRFLEHSQPDGKVEILKQKYKLWGEFYILTICYLYFTRIVVQLLVASLPYNIIWLSDFFYELSTLLFYIVVGYKFRPVPSNPYLQVDTDEEAVAVEEIQLENIGGVSHKRKGFEAPSD